MKISMDAFKVLSKNRFVILGLFFLIFCSIQYFFYHTFLPSTETKDLWFYSGLFMVLYSMLIIEPYYTSPKNVITNIMPLILVFIAIKDFFANSIIWWVSVITLICLLISSIIALTLNDNEKSPDHWKNKVAEIVKNIVVFFGRGRILYSAVFIYFLLTYYSVQNIYTIVLFIFWASILTINPINTQWSFNLKNNLFQNDQIGEIIGVESKKVFRVKLFENKFKIKTFDIVKFNYSMQTEDGYLQTGIVLDTNLLAKEKWIKVLQLGEAQKTDTKFQENQVYRVTSPVEIEAIQTNLKINRLVGVVIKESDIGNLKFEYSKMLDNLQEGDLLELGIYDKRLFYQVINGITDKEDLEPKNKNGFIRGEAIQLGEWQKDDFCFKKYGWVPSINTPIFFADTSDIEIPIINYPEYKLGVIPGTNLPAIINLADAVSHHMALLGVTGSGKTYLAVEIIKELSKDTKIICVDLTGEWTQKLDELQPIHLIKPDGLVAVEEKLALLEDARKNKKSTEVLKYKKEIQEKLCTHVTNFVESNSNISIFDIPDLSNTTFILEFTQMFLESVFVYAKRNPGKKYCIVLEEAHTIVPETSFLGDLGDYSSNKGLVSKMGQIALQGRKFGIGLFIIAQRTAIVSKTVLTQCNTVVCFQAFDETSINFLSNYVGAGMVKIMPNLKQYHAIVAGKAMKSSIPMIVDLTRI